MVVSAEGMRREPCPGGALLPAASIGREKETSQLLSPSLPKAVSAEGTLPGPGASAGGSE